MLCDSCFNYLQEIQRRDPWYRPTSRLNAIGQLQVYPILQTEIERTVRPWFQSDNCTTSMGWWGTSLTSSNLTSRSELMVLVIPTISLSHLWMTGTTRILFKSCRFITGKTWLNSRWNRGGGAWIEYSKSESQYFSRDGDCKHCWNWVLCARVAIGIGHWVVADVMAVVINPKKKNWKLCQLSRSMNFQSPTWQSHLSVISPWWLCTTGWIIRRGKEDSSRWIHFHYAIDLHLLINHLCIDLTFIVEGSLLI
jgi:hypothetical protein